MTKKILGMLTLVVGLISPLAFAKNDLVIGTNPAYPPFEYKSESNELIGFDIDIMNELCTIMEKKCTYSEQTFDALIPNLRLRRFDLVISSMDVTEERKKQVSFSDPYYLNYSIYVTTKDRANAIDNLSKEKIGVLSGSTHQQYIRDTYREATISNYPQYPAAISDLLIGRINIVFGDGEVVYDYVKNNDKLMVVGDKITDSRYFGIGLAIAARKNDDALVVEVNNALATLKASSRYQEIHDKWFDQ